MAGVRVIGGSIVSEKQLHERRRRHRGRGERPVVEERKPKRVTANQQDRLNIHVRPMRGVSAALLLAELEEDYVDSDVIDDETLFPDGFRI